ncbi:MAG: hypothetical protein RLZZ312_887 [Bacteroidota bacterium]|jgi:hypothetical protein
MPKQTADNLFILIKSLSQSEKRHFKVYANRLLVNSESKFLQLFDFLDKAKVYNEFDILNSKIVTKQQLSNLKAHLYKQILVSLRMNPENQNTRINIREQLDFATILYHKGLYKQSLSILDKAKQIAIDYEEKNIAYEIVELEKVIESQYITRSEVGRATILAQESKELSKNNVLASKLSNISLQLYAYMLKNGYAKNEIERERISSYFNNNLPLLEFKKLGFREKLWFYKANLWYNFLIQDFVACYKFSKKWVDLFYANPKMIFLNPVWFIKGNSYFLECLYFVKHQRQFETYFEKINQITNHSNFPKNDNLASLQFLCNANAKINFCFLTGNFDDGISLINNILININLNENRIDQHHVMVLYYKIGCLYFGIDDYKNCIFYLKKIIENTKLSMREDLMCFARVLCLIAHYDAGLDNDLDNQAKSTFSFLLKMNELHEVQREMLLFLRNIENFYPLELKSEFKKLHSQLIELEKRPFENRAFLYLDVISWLESKIENRPIGDIIREKFRKNLR